MTEVKKEDIIVVSELPNNNGITEEELKEFSNRYFNRFHIYPCGGGMLSGFAEFSYIKGAPNHVKIPIDPANI